MQSVGNLKQVYTMMHGQKNIKLCYIFFSSEDYFVIFLLCVLHMKRCGIEPQGSQLLSAVLRRMQDNLQCGASAVPQEVETLCGDTNLAPEIRLRALELLQVQRKLFLFLYSCQLYEYMYHIHSVTITHM